MSERKVKICACCGKPFLSVIRNAKYCHNPCVPRKKSLRPKGKKVSWTLEMIERWNRALQESAGVERLANLITESKIKIEIRNRRIVRNREIRKYRLTFIKKKRDGGAA